MAVMLHARSVTRKEPLKDAIADAFGLGHTLEAVRSYSALPYAFAEPEKVRASFSSAIVAVTPLFSCTAGKPVTLAASTVSPV
jgi:hypothetical protein